MKNEMVNVKTKSAVLLIGATDTLGLSGIQADLRALQSMGVHGGCVITATTSQNQHGFSALNAVSNDVLKSQLDALLHQDIFTAVKIGLIANFEQAYLIKQHPLLKNKPIILDPVLAATSGSIESRASRLAGIKFLLPMVDLLTPNLDEAGELLVAKIVHQDDMKKAAMGLIAAGLQAVFIKGGHGQVASRDYFHSIGNSFYLQHEQYNHSFTRGTGCVLASLIAAALALKASLPDAVVMAKMQLDAGFSQPFKIDDVSGSLNLPPWIDMEDFSALSHLDQAALPVKLCKVFTSQMDSTLEFAPCDLPMGLYPVVSSLDELKMLLPLGINIIQLRIKDVQGDELKLVIKAAIKLSKQYNVSLFINDYWQLAIEFNAYGVHLGQEDLQTADLKAIARAGLRLGLSSHCYHEVARAYTINPSYIAFGPVFETSSKTMPWIVQGIKGLRYWRTLLKGRVLVAIGGINRQRYVPVKNCAVEGIAMISAITAQTDPVEACNAFLQLN